MEMKMHTAFRWMAWGTFCTAIHLEFGQIKLFPVFVGFAMVFYGLLGLEKAGKADAGILMKPAMALLILAALAEFASGFIDLKWLFRGGYFMLATAVLEFTGYLNGMLLMEKCGRKVQGWRLAYLIAGVTAMSAGVCVLLSQSVPALLFTSFSLLAGRMIFFCCVWGESRKTEVEDDG